MGHFSPKRLEAFFATTPKQKQISRRRRRESLCLSFSAAMPISTASSTVFFHPFLIRSHTVPFLSNNNINVPHLLLLLFCLVSSATAAAAAAYDHLPIVTTEYGTIRGQLHHVVDHVDGQPVTMASFIGVPYARPPLGELRFEKPLKPEKWVKVFNTIKMPPACWPIVSAEITTEPDPLLSEDCLYLNIFGPQKLPTAANDVNVLLPVLVYIHGGGFQSGSMRQFKPHAVAKFVRRGLLFVTLQYRLAMLGFASTGDESFAGNYGLWDQAMALQFLHDNLRNFGGDPSRVTLWGFSAGAMSWKRHIIDEINFACFRYAIQQSGAIFVEWAANERVLGETARLAMAVGCAEEDQEDLGKRQKSDILKQCLRRKTPQELMDGIAKIGRGRPELNFIQFQPRYEPNFFPAGPITLIQNAPPKRSLMGVTMHEALTFTLFSQDPTMMSTQIPRAQWASFGRAEFEKFVAEKVAPEKHFGESAQTVQQRILQFYCAKNGENESESEIWLAKYSEVITDIIFLVPLLLEARQKSTAGWPIYLYQLDHINTGYPDDIPVKGTVHCMELEPLFDIPIPYKVENWTACDKRVQHELIDTFTNFAKNGIPRTESLSKWHPIDRQSPLQYAIITSDGTQMQQALAPKKLDFWRKLSTEFTYDIIRGIHHGTLHSTDEL